MTKKRLAGGRERRPAFTLIELLVVIVILALLVGLLVPAVMRAVGTARDAQVSAEIQALSQAIAAFRSAHGDLPPSRIVISESGDYSAGTLGQTAPLGPRTMTYLRKFWPRMQLSTSGPTMKNLPGQYYDVNGNQTLDAPYVLTGPECLVLFLGGVPQNVGGTWTVTGFSRSPMNPFQNAVDSPANRSTPFFEFKSERLVPNVNNPTLTAATPFPGFVDALGIGSTNPDGMIPFYMYFSSYGGAGYDPNDCDGVESDTSGGISTVLGAFMAPGSILTGSTPPPQILPSPAPNPYTASCPVPTKTDGSVNAPAPGNQPKSRIWQQPQSYQIISAGRDRYFGIGGQYIASGNVKLPFIFVDPANPATANYVPDSQQTKNANDAVTGQPNIGTDERFREGDNITNFSAGKLD